MTQTTRFQSDDEDPTTRQVAALPCVGDYPVIGQYILCSQLGAGGAGAVYMGYHVKLQRPVAIKILNPAVLKMSDKAVARFTREAILSSQIRSGHIIPVTDAGTVPGTEIHYIIMDLVDGENAEDRVARKGGQLSVAEALTVIRDATIGLADAHRQEVIHRDLKPANIMISTAGEVRLADLGIATSFDRPNLNLTQSDEFLGTPQYMSPEQIRGDPLDGRTDVYSMGVTLHHLLTGVHPFQGPTAYAVMQRVESEALPDIREFRDDVPANVAGLIQAATQRDRDERIPSSEAMVSRLEVLLRKQGQVTLADPEAGGENRSRYVELPSEELQKMQPEVEKIARATAATGVGRKGIFAALVVVLLLLVTGVGLASFLAETPIDRQVRTAMQESDHPAVAAGLADALTSTNLNAPARAALVREVATWVADTWETPEAYLDAGDEGAFKVLTILVSEQSEPFEAWLIDSVEGEIKQKDWAGLGKLLDDIEQWGGLHDGLRDQVARRVAQPFEREVRDRPTSPIGADGQAVLNRMATLGSERCKNVGRLQAISTQPAHSTDELREWFTLAEGSGLLSAMLDDLLAATQRTLVESGETARDVLPMLAEFSQASPAFEKAAVDRVIQYAQQALTGHDWSMALSAIDVLRALPSSDPAAIVELERGALAAVAGAADLTPAGIIAFPGNDPGPLLQALVQRGVPGAVRWLIEARVTWNDEDRMVWRDGVTLEQKTQFPDLVRRAGTEFEPADLQRIIFLKAEASQWRLLPLSDEERTRTTLTSLMDGVQFGSADCSARYLSLVAIFGIEEAQRSIRAVDREPPTWQQLQTAFAPVLDPQSGQRFGLARARCWYGYGSLTYNPDARLNDLATVRQALELMLLAGEDGYVYALKPIDSILTALGPVYTQPVPTGPQQSRLNALRAE